MTNQITCELIDVMGSDADIAAAARVSYGNRSKPSTDAEDERLIRYLVRHGHTSPFEMAEMKFHIRAPIFVARQMVRHRTANWNEVSGRYTELPDDYWTPETWRSQSSTNKQASASSTPYSPRHFDDDGDLSDPSAPWPIAEDLAFLEYNRRLDAGVARELARTCPQLSTMTEWIWKNDLHNIFNFLRLRRSAHAQPEIRIIADAIAGAASLNFPLSLNAFDDYITHAITLTAPEILALTTNTRPHTMTDSEWSDFLVKADRLNPPISKDSSCC